MGQISYPVAIKEVLNYSMSRDKSIYLLGLGVADSAGIFGSTLGLAEAFPGRVIEPPVSEAAFTGAAIGSALTGMRPVVVFQRSEFAILALDQIINHAAKIRYMSGGKQICPLVVRIIVGKGWGNGAQHSQSLQSVFAHIPGLNVVMPCDPFTGQGVFMAALESEDPTIIIEHRDVFKSFGDVADSFQPISYEPRQVQCGCKETVVALSSMVDVAKVRYPEADIFNLISLSPSPNFALIKASYNKTGNLVVMDTGWTEYGVVDHIVAKVMGNEAVRVGLPGCPTPTSVELEKKYYEVYDPEFKGPF